MRVLDFDEGHIRSGISLNSHLLKSLRTSAENSQEHDEVGAAVYAFATLQCFTTADGCRQFQAAYFETN